MITHAYYDWKYLHKLRYDWKYFHVMHTAYCIVLFCCLLSHLAPNSCIWLHTGAYGYISLHIVSKFSVWLEMVAQGFVLLGWLHMCRCSHIDVHKMWYGRISLYVDCIWICWIIWLYIVACILKWMHDVNLIVQICTFSMIHMANQYQDVVFIIRVQNTFLSSSTLNHSM